MSFWDALIILIAVIVVVVILEEMYVTPIKREQERLRDDLDAAARAMRAMDSRQLQAQHDLIVLAKIISKLED